MLKLNLLYLIFFLMTQLTPAILAQETHEDESKVPDYQLPDPLITSDGNKVTSAQMWQEVRRPEILQQFAEQMYGKFPEGSVTTSYQMMNTRTDALNGKATRKEVRLWFSNGTDSTYMDLLVYIPNEAPEPVPAFLGLSFYGNHTISPESDIILSEKWMPEQADFGIENHRATEASRSVRVNRWPVEKIIDRGYALATAYYGDLDPDYAGDDKNGIQPLFYKERQTQPEKDEWGSIGAWAWGLQKAMDYLETDGQINPAQVAVLGHSRIGKAALWAGASDERFAMVISNDSGCGGAALSRRRFGETVKVINTAFPHWFNENFKQYNNNEDALPFDQHELIALIAPRPVYIASASQDLWADPKGEFLGGLHASLVYELFGHEGLAATEMPPADQPVASGYIGYHLRTGKHDLTEYDWERYMDFADQHFGKGSKDN